MDFGHDSSDLHLHGLPAMDPLVSDPTVPAATVSHPEFPWIAAALIGSAIIGSKTANKAGKAQAKAADAQAEAQKYAADKQFEASQAGIAAWERHQEQARADIAPWREAGMQALNMITGGIASGQFKVANPDLPEYKGPGDFKASKDTELPEFQRPEGSELPEFKRSAGSELPTWEGFGADQMELDPGYQFRLEEGMRAIQRSAAAGSGAGTGATGKAMMRYGQNMASQEFAAARSRAVQDYNIATTRAREVYGRDVGEYGMAVDRANTLYGRGVTEHGMAVDRANTLYGREYDAHRLEVDEARYRYDAEYRRAIDDYNISRGEADREYNRLAGVAGAGQTATGTMIDSSALGTGAIGDLTMTGAEALGAGRIGAANAKQYGAAARANAWQTSWNNLMQMAGLGLGMYNSGAFDGGGGGGTPWVNPDLATMGV